MIEAFVPAGYLAEPAPAEQGGVNAAAFDSWTAVHAGMGLLLGAVGVPFWWALGLSAAYEVVEYAHEWPRGSTLFGSKRPESASNIAADMVVFMGGWGAASAVRAA